MKTSKVNCRGNADYKLPAGEASYAIQPIQQLLCCNWRLEMCSLLQDMVSRGNCHDYHYYHEISVRKIR
jgi:hypothetical protein